LKVDAPEPMSVEPNQFSPFAQVDAASQKAATAKTAAPAESRAE